jgi:hypothetical protein
LKCPAFEIDGSEEDYWERTMMGVKEIETDEQKELDKKVVDIGEKHVSHVSRPEMASVVMWHYLTRKDPRGISDALTEVEKFLEGRSEVEVLREIKKDTFRDPAEHIKKIFKDFFKIDLEEVFNEFQKK